MGGLALACFAKVFGAVFLGQTAFFRFSAGHGDSVLLGQARRLLPAVVLAIAVGRYTGRRIDARRFLFYVHVGLLVIGAILLWQAVASRR